MILLGNGNLLGIGIAALGGAAVGIDRQRAYRENEAGAIGGIRTFTILGTIAGVCGFLIANGLLLTAIVILAGLTLLILIVRLSAGSISRDATTEVAAMAVLAFGVVAGLGHHGMASALYAWTVLLLIEKSSLHAIAARIGVVELEAAAQFAAMALVVYPILPSKNFGPNGILNLRSIWILVLIFSAISFAGHLARKALGNQAGWVLTGLIGGLISSTQVTFAFSHESRRYPQSFLSLFGGVMAATSVSMLRVCVLCIFLRPSLAAAMLAAVSPAVVIGGLASLYCLRRSSSEPSAFDEKSPLRVFAAIYLALIFIASQCLITFARMWFGTAGIFGSAGLLGSIDIDALVASLVPMVRQGLQTSETTQILLIGIISNTAVKLVIALLWGQSGFRKYVVPGFVGILAALFGSLAWIRR
jgi:uncharacterized membrane protein (DUF4010 family)